MLEDDAAIADTVSSIVDHINNTPPGYDICRIGKSIWNPYIRLEKVNAYHWTYERKFTNCTVAYIISKAGAKKVLAHAEGRIDLPADDILTKTHICTSGFNAYTPDHYLF